METIHSGSVTAPGSGAAICTIPATGLPAGHYRIDVSSSVSNNAVADLGNMRLRKAGVDVVSPIPHGANGQPVDFFVNEIRLSGIENLTVEAIGAGTVAIEYNATITATRL